MLSQYLKWAIVVGLFSVILITPFYVSSSMFFPFITGKNFFFRIVVEIIFALWIILAMADTRYRPQRSPVLWAAMAVVAVLTLSTIFGANPYRSFWSNYERMEGLIGHLHLFAYFLVLSGVFITQKEWRRFFYGISVSGAAMAVYGYMQAFGKVAISAQSGPRVDGTFGNASYMAIFMLFAVFVAAYLYFSEDKKWLKNIFTALVILEIPVVFLTATRGAILGLVGGAVLLVLFLAFLSQDHRVKIASLCVIAGIVALVSAFLLLQNRDFITQNPVFSRFSNLSFQDRTVQSRFTIWGMSYEAFKERPILGWGLENYNQVFNKYYRPSLWPQEPWFDRSHNVIFDWLIHGGILGLFSYLFLYGSALYLIWKNYFGDKKSENLALAAVFTSLLSAYFFHNFFVFDNLVSYILFLSLLAFIHGYGSGQSEASSASVSDFTPTRSFVASLIIFVTVFALYFLNIKPIMANTWLLQALKDSNTQGQNADLVLSDFQKVLNLGTFGSGEGREQLSSYANAVAKSNLTQPLKDKVVQVSVMELERQVEDSPKDARGYIFLSAMYANAGRHEDAYLAVTRALELSPKKQQIMFLLADAHINQGNLMKAREAVKTAYDLDPAYPEAVKNFAVLAIINGLQDEADEVLLKYFGTILVAEQRLVSAYARVGRYDRIRDLWLELLKQRPENAQYRVNLAATYIELGDRQKAIQELERAIEFDPQFKESGGYLINEIRAGRNPAR